MSRSPLLRIFACGSVFRELQLRPARNCFHPGWSASLRTASPRDSREATLAENRVAAIPKLYAGDGCASLTTTGAGRHGDH